MAANTNLNLVPLDFDDLKNDFVAYLQTQDRWRDYDFAGSDLNVLMELMAFNTHKMAFFLNMAISEGFIDSAQVRTSILSHAKELNYTPRSMRSSKATVTVTFSATGENQPYIVQKGQSFAAQIKNQNFIFSMPETITVASANTLFSFTTDIYEGTYVKDTYVFDTNSLKPLRFKINNPNVDTDSIVVNVYEDGRTVADVYAKTTSLLGLNGNSKVHFIQTNAADGNYEILFGDGVLGRRPKNGALIVIDYRITSGPLSNGSAVFSINFDPTVPSSTTGELTSSIITTTTEVARGGALAEDIETTRFYAPRWFQTQERAVVPSDYAVLMQTQFPEINAINVYGGETLTPPQFGKVVVAVDISNVQGLPQSKVDQYYNFLKPRMMLTEFPLFVSPQYTYIDIETLVRYNVNVTNETDSRIKTLVLATISDFNTENLNTFDVTFRYSKFLKAIDDTDSSILSNITNINIYKKLIPTLNTTQSHVLLFETELVNDLPKTDAIHSIDTEKVLTSSLFTYNSELASLEDDGEGNIRIVKTKNDNYETLAVIGKIDYDTGLVQLNQFNIESYDGSALLVYVRPRDLDVSCSKNTIMSIEPSQVGITVEQIRD